MLDKPDKPDSWERLGSAEEEDGPGCGSGDWDAGAGDRYFLQIWLVSSLKASKRSLGTSLATLKRKRPQDSCRLSPLVMSPI